MIENIKISLWDFGVYFITGALLIFTAIFYFPEKTEYLKNTAVLIDGDSAKAVFYAIITYAVGLMFEPIGNYFSKFFLDSTIRKIPRINSQEVMRQEQDEYYEMVKKIIEKKYSIIGDKVEYYQIAKTEVLRSDSTNKFMTFLGNYGFYRNLSVIVLINLILFLFSWDYALDYKNILAIIGISLIFLIVHFIFYRRGREFYYYSGNEIYKNFLVQNGEEKAN